jgi:hypothetical protein
MHKVSGDGKGVIPYRVNVGMEYRTIRATIPLIELTATQNRLEFRVRFGPGRLIGPWRFKREQVTDVFTTPGWFTNRVHVRGDHFEVQVFAYSPEPLLLTLEELGYPVDWILRR